MTTKKAPKKETMTIHGELYLNTAASAEFLDLKHGTFYRNTRNRIKPKRMMGKRTPWYKESDLIAFREGRQVRMATITLTGIYKNWEHALRREGFEVESKTLGLDIVYLPDELVQAFHLPADQEFVRREKMTLADGIPLCTWYTYYPRQYIDDETYQAMKQDTYKVSAVERIKEQHGIVVGKARDRLQSRTTTLDEQNIFRLPTDDALIILQRVSWTRDKKTVVFVQDMKLLGSWFAPEYEYDVDIWD